MLTTVLMIKQTENRERCLDEGQKQNNVLFTIQNSLGGKEVQISFPRDEFDNDGCGGHSMFSPCLFLFVSFFIWSLVFQFTLLSLFKGNLFVLCLFRVCFVFYCFTFIFYHFCLFYFSSILHFFCFWGGHFLVLAAIFCDWVKQNKNSAWRFGLIYPLVFYPLLHISRSCCGL